jgi:hypothetical protein
MADQDQDLLSKPGKKRFKEARLWLRSGRTLFRACTLEPEPSV